METYLLVYHHRNTVNQRTTFDKREWQVPIYLDTARKQVLKKSVQCGMSTRCEIIAFAELIRGHAVLYVHPTRDDLAAFVQVRIDESLLNVPYYGEILGKGQVDRVGVKKFKRGALKSVTANVKGSFTAFTAQCIIIDELDQCNMKNIEYADDRTAAMKLLMDEEPLKILNGNPSVPGFGISEEYDLTDQKSYCFKCTKCNEWQPYDWFENVVQKIGDNEYELINSVTPVIVCRKCHTPLHPEAKKLWIQKYPLVDASGWQISQLFTEQFTVQALSDSFFAAVDNPTKMQVFYNSRLGIAYTGEGDALSLNDFSNCSEDYSLGTPSSDSTTIAGIDVGKVYHVRVDELVEGKRKMVFAGTVRTERELITLLKRCRVNMYCMDADPETRMGRLILKNYPNGWLVRYNTNVKLSGMAIDKAHRIITVNRTESLDTVTAAYLHGEMIVPKNFRQIDNGEWVKQMLAPVRILDVDRKPPAFVWKEGNKKDHHRHSCNYCHIAGELLGFGNKQFKVQWIG